MWRVLLLVAAAAAQQKSTEPGQFQVVYEWFRLDFAWPDDTSKATALGSSRFTPESPALRSVRAWKDRLYLTVPRWRPGVPATLTSVPLVARGHNASPKLEPFPSWAMQQINNCSALQSVQAIEIDKQGFMWVVDTGRINTLTDHPDLQCPPKLVIFDLNTVGDQIGGRTSDNYGYSTNDNNQNPAYNSGQPNTSPYGANYYPAGANMSARIVSKFVFPGSVVALDSSLDDIVLDDTDGEFAYISDSSESDPGLIVFSKRDSRAWKVRDDATMRADREASSVTVSGVTVPLRSNVAGLALSPPGPNRTLYYSPLASYSLYALPTSVLRDPRAADVSRQVVRVGRKTSPSQAMTMDAEGRLYYGLLAMNEVARWDTNMPFENNQKYLSKDDQYLQWPASLSFDSKGNLWGVTNRMQNYLMGTLNLNEPNFRVLQAQYDVKSYLYSPEKPQRGMTTSSTTGEPSSDNGRWFGDTDSRSHGHDGHDHSREDSHDHSQEDHGPTRPMTGNQASGAAATAVALLAFLRILPALVVAT